MAMLPRGGALQPMAMLPLIYFTFWTMRYFRRNYTKPHNRLTMERAMELDEEVKISNNQGREVPPKSFSCEHYKQPVLTEASRHPFFYRMGQEDPMTAEARRKLRGGNDRTSMWSPEREKRASITEQINISMV
mmetsp:Transcript_4433/g.6777  ORF Transcript_4433/g.6777 Transcript_4433/m.6777 type:complete len:133 (-) Transcript_4433:172-570(-)